MLKTVDKHTFLVDTLYFIVGSFLYALGLYTFALNAAFAPGGVSGVALIIYRFTGMPLGILSLLLNIPLVFLCLKYIGRTFLAKSLWTMLISTFFLDVFFPLFPVYNGSPLLASMFTGVMVGAGLAIIYMRGSSSGGADFISLTLKKLKPHWSLGKIVMATDAVVIVLGGIVFGSVDAVLYGIISSFATAQVMDSILYGAGSSKLAIIVTNKGQETAHAISESIGRGSTLMQAVGTHTGKVREVLLCACGKSEIHKVRITARSIDRDSIVVIAEASEVFGEGFTPPKLPGNEDIG